MTATLNAASKSILEQMGYKDVNDFVISQSRRILEEKIKEQQSSVTYFEQKYGMSYDDFIVRVLDKSDPVLSKFGIIEKEDDDFDWENAIDFLRIYNKRLQAL